MQNVEFKAELRDPDLCRRLLKGDVVQGAIWIECLEQFDTYYRVPDGKLKRRETTGYPTEYIFYSRAHRTRPKLSNFTIYTESQALSRFGATPLPIWLTIKKSRELWLHRGVRIHLDTVEGLGNFIEFEALVCPERNLARCHELIEALRQTLATAIGEPISSGYAELATTG
jgi:adenylate cyclase, class 2